MLNYAPINITRTIFEAINNKPLPSNVSVPLKDALLGLTAEAPQSLWDYVPTFINTSYILPTWGVETCKLLSTRFPIYLYGASGTGKSTLIRWIASTFHLPLYEITAHNRLETPELVGSYQLRNGQTIWQDGPLTKAMRQGGIFLINELSLLDPSTATGLNTVLDGQPLVIPETSEVVTPHDAFYFVATDNTNGQGDDSGLFLGTLSQNQALMGRFILKKAEYISSQVEQKIILKAEPDLPQATVQLMIKYATDNRASLENSQTPLTNPITPRDMLKWARLIEVYKPLQKQLEASGKNLLSYTLDLAYLARLTAGDRLIAEELFHVVFG